MAERASDEQVAALQQAAIDFRNPDHIPSSAGWWLGKAVDALLAERARAEAAEADTARIWDVLRVARTAELDFLERLKLAFDACICDCGAPWCETDGADLVNERLRQLKENADAR